MLLDSGEEMALGLEAQAEIAKTENFETGTARAKRVERIGKRIAAVADRDDFTWEFYTVVKSELNAFCLPGGKIYFYTGMLDFLGKDDALVAAIMGHEVAMPFPGTARSAAVRTCWWHSGLPPPERRQPSPRTTRQRRIPSAARPQYWPNWAFYSLSADCTSRNPTTSGPSSWPRPVTTRVKPSPSGRKWKRNREVRHGLPVFSPPTRSMPTG